MSHILNYYLFLGLRCTVCLFVSVLLVAFSQTLLVKACGDVYICSKSCESHPYFFVQGAGNTDPTYAQFSHHGTAPGTLIYAFQQKASQRLRTVISMAAVNRVTEALKKGVGSGFWWICSQDLCFGTGGWSSGERVCCWRCCLTLFLATEFSSPHTGN